MHFIYAIHKINIMLRIPAIIIIIIIMNTNKRIAFVHAQGRPFAQTQTQTHTPDDYRRAMCSAKP